MNHHEDRISRLAAILDETGTDLCVILQNVDMYYFTGTLVQGFLLVKPDGNYCFCVQKPISRAMEESRLQPVNEASSPKKWEGIVKDFCQGKSIRKLGMETDVVPWDLANLFANMFPQAKLVNISPPIRKLRSIKNETELDAIRRAGVILGETFEALACHLSLGMKELEIAAFVEQKMRLLGHQGVMRVRKFNMELYYGALGVSASVRQPTLFDGPVGSGGLYAAAPFFAGNAPFLPGDTLMVDLMAGVEGYLADGTRTYALEPVPDEIGSAHQALLEILETTRRGLVPGAIPEQLYQQALDLAAKAGISEGFMGFGENRVRFLGHGLGLEIDELPVLAPRFSEPLEENMVVAVEPKLFTPTFATGVEDTFIVTPFGGEAVIPCPDGILYPGQKISLSGESRR